jgi:hypothetical protein
MIELATTKEQPKMTKSAQIRNYVAANPKAKSADVAKAIGVTTAYVATVMWTAKKKAKLAKKLGGMQKKKALTDKSNWKQLGLFSSNKSMGQLAYEAGEAQAQVDKYWKAVGEVQKAGLSPERIAELSAQAAKPKARMQIEMFEPKPDAVNHPTHYKVGGIETIDFIEAKKLGYNLGNVVKYLTRADHKGNKLQDLRKAQWYLEREIFNVENNKKTA